MPTRELFPEFRAQQSASRYPFTDTATLRADGDSGLTIDTDSFIDASLYPIGATGPLYLSHIEVETFLVTLSLSDSRAVRATGTFNPQAPTDIVEFHDSYGRPAGAVISEAVRLARFSSWPVGTYLFRAAATEFVASCVIPTPEQGVRGVLTDAGELLSGDLWLVGDNGVVLRHEGDGVIRVDVVGDPLFLRRLCTPVELFKTPNFLRTINGCPPDEFGNYNLTVGDHASGETIVRLYPTDKGLVIEAIGRTVRGG